MITILYDFKELNNIRERVGISWLGSVRVENIVYKI